MKITAYKYIHSICFLFIILVSTLLVSCTSTPANKYSSLPTNVAGKLIFVGIPLKSGPGINSTGEHTYWQYNIPTKTYTKLDETQTIIGQENFKERVSYYICYRDKQKLLATQEPLIYELMKICEQASEYSMAKDKYFQQKLGLTNNDDIISPAGWYRITSNHQNKTITINNKYSKAPIVIQLDNDFGFQTLSPDTNYLVLLEFTPGLKPFGIQNQTYRLRFINIVTGQVYSVDNDKIVLPIALEWIR